MCAVAADCRLVRSLAVTEPIVLEGVAFLFFALLDYRNAILGSSVSNLYRTRHGRLWVLHPGAWLARSRRNAKTREVASPLG